ncbi:MAG TPA: hypothetical protein ENI07_13710 [Desulfobacterales bacterium]|nr:hypothetical protein [Desulfobacterales bacterium]
MKKMMNLKDIKKYALKTGLECGFNIMLWFSSVRLVRWWVQRNSLYRKKLDYDWTFGELIRRVVGNYESMFESDIPVETDSLGKGITKKLLNQFGYVMIELKHYARDSLRATKVLHEAHLELKAAKISTQIAKRVKDGRRISGSLINAAKKSDQNLAKFKHLKSAKAPDMDFVRHLANYYAKDIIADYDPVFYKIFKNFAKLTFVRHLDKNLIVSEDSLKMMEEIKHLTENHAFVFISNHVSNADHAPIFFALNRHGIYQPSTIAGKNLDHGFSSKIFPRVNARWLNRGIMLPPEEVEKLKWFTLLWNMPGQRSGTELWKELKKYGVGWVNNPIYRETDKAYTHIQLEHLQPILFYIEGGRSTTGTLRAPKIVIFEDMLDYVRKTGKPVYLGPTAISYTIIGEDKALETARRGEKNISEGDLVSQLSKLNKVTGPDSPIYVHFGKPIRIGPDDLSERPKKFARQVNEYAAQMMTAIGNGIKNTATYLLAATIVKNQYEKNFTLQNAKTDMTIMAKTLEEEMSEAEVEKGLNTALAIFEKKGFIQKKDGLYEILNIPLIRQYGRRIEHKLVK